MTGKAALLFHTSGAQNQGCFELTTFKIGLVLASARGLYELNMTARAWYLGLFEYLMGDRLLSGGLDRLFGQLVAEFASTPPLVEFDVCEVTQVAGGLAHLKFFLLRLMLMAVRAVDLLALNLVLLIEMWFMDESHFLREFDPLGLEFVIRLAMAVGGHAAGVHDPGPRLNRLTPQG